MSSRGSTIVLCALLAVLVAGWLAWRNVASARKTQDPPVHVTKQPVNFATRTFDPASFPADMPPLGAGEAAVCDSNFSSSASVAGTLHPTDGAHATMTVRRVDVTLQLNVTIWVPNGASQHVIEHEEGHREISEYYYKTADKLAERIAETYVGRQVPIAGGDLNTASSTALHQLATEFTDDYGKELNPDPAQQLYDSITDHSRNSTDAKNAASVAIKNVEMTATHTSGN